MIVASTILLLGPTGSGKTPLGELLEREGLWGRRCFHLDFGARLRSVAAGILQLDGVEGWSVREILESGRLLEKDEFLIAERILAEFLAATGAGAGDLLVLNGLPRHVSQAADVDRILTVTCVVSLLCDAHTVYERIRLNSGGDRTGRNDDSEADIAGKLRTFEQRTIPLLDHYRGKGVEIRTHTVGIHTTPGDILTTLEA